MKNIIAISVLCLTLISMSGCKVSMWKRLAVQVGAKLGYAPAQFILGLMYAKGQGVPQDYAETVKWWRKAAEQGDVDAQFNLGCMYNRGQGVPQDYVEAAKWWHKAAEQGDAPAQNILGNMYNRGEGVPQDYVEAHKWYNLAYISDQDRSRMTSIEAKMTPDQIAEAQRLAREWHIKHTK